MQGLFINLFPNAEVPLNGFQILLADVVLPLIFLIGGGLVVWFLQGFNVELLSMGLLLIPLIALLLALCGAFALTRDRVLMSRLLATGVSFGLAIIVTAWLHTPLAGLIVIMLAITILSQMLVLEA